MTLPSDTLSKQSPSTEEASVAASGGEASFRLRPERMDRTTPFLPWMLGTALCFLAAGLAGVKRPVVDVPGWMTQEITKPPVETMVQEITMDDLAGAPAPEEPAPSEVTTETPPVTPEEVLEEPPDEPEPLLSEKDIIPLPEPPKIETALRPLDPPPPTTPKPKPAATPAATKPATSPSPAATSAQGTGTGGSFGTGTAATGGGKGKFPHPPYPSFARSRKISGTVTLSIRVSPEGRVIESTVSGSCGSAELDNYAASWVTRRWKWPTGALRSFRLPITFRLQ